MHTSRPNADSNPREPTLREWRRPELCKLPIEATSGSTVKPGANNSDGVAGTGPKPADSSGQVS
jgi:hypothetical protein